MHFGASGTGHAEHAAHAHAAWLQLFWPKGMYSHEAHASLAQMYLADDRFRQHYVAWAPGTTQFLVRAIQTYANRLQ